MNGAFDDRFLHIGLRQRLTGLQLAFQCFMKISHHDHPGFYSDSKERNVTDRDGDAKVIVKKPLQQQSSAHRIDGWKDENKRFCNRVKDKIEQQEDHEEDDRKNQL